MPRLNRERHTISKMVLEIFRTTCIAYFGDERFGFRAQDLLIMCAAAVGQFENKPLSESDLSAYLGIPRSTIGRIIARLARQKQITLTRVRGRSLVHVTRIDHEATLVNAYKMMKNITKSSTALAKTGNPAIERGS